MNRGTAKKQIINVLLIYSLRKRINFREFISVTRTKLYFTTTTVVLVVMYHMHPPSAKECCIYPVSNFKSGKMDTLSGRVHGTAGAGRISPET